MSPAQVQPNSSRKQGHLEAGKKKLEEFRKRKAEERAKKAGYTVPSQSIDEGSDGKSSQNHGHEGGRTTSSTSTDFSGLQSTPVQKDGFFSTDKHVISSNENAQMSNSSEKPGDTGLVNGYHSRWKDSSELFNNHQSNFETVSVATAHPFATSDSVHANVDLEETLDKPSLYHASSEEIMNSSSARISYVDASSTAGLQKSEAASTEGRFELPSISLNSSSAFKDSSLGLGIYNPSSFNNEATVDSQVGRKTISESISQHLNLGNSSWHSSDSLIDSSVPVRRAQDAYSSPSTSYGVISGRSRPSFLDTLGVSKGSSTSHVPPNPPVSFSGTKVQSADDVHFPSHQLPFTNVGTLQHSSSSSPSDLVDEKVNSSVSNNLQMLERNRDYLQGSHEILFPKKDEEFSALEQHIEDLTREKFALQRALDASSTVVESLKIDNSSLTESYNQQANVCNELRSEIERLQEKANYHMRALESLKQEYGNAQLECSAADERAKIFASEVIELEEKALRLRSNELKLEKQLEELASEISSYRRKVSSLEKERQDFQSTINMMQEEKKVLQSKLRKASSNSKDDDTIKISSCRRDMSTSTFDLGDDFGRHTNEAEIMTSNTMSVLRNETTSNDVASTSSLRDDRSFHLPDGSVKIPHDQLRMIDNINSLLSELALEKEELIHALTIESSNSSKLKDLNKELSRKLEVQTQRLELLTAQRMANEHILTKPVDTHSIPDTMEYADEGDEVVDRVLGWIMKFFPGGSSKRRASKLL